MTAAVDLVDDIMSMAVQLGQVAGYADTTVERDLRLAVECLDNAVTRCQARRHEHTRSLLDGTS